MADIKQAIEAAKQDPNSAFATELRKRIESGKMNKELESAGMPTFKGKQGFTERVKEDFQERGDRITDAIAGEDEFEGQSNLRRSTAAVATAASAPFKVIKEAAPEPVREALDFAGEKIGQGLSFLTDKISDSKALQDWVSKNPQAAKQLEDIAGIGANTGEIAGNILGAQGAATTLQKGTNLAQKGGSVVVDKTSDLANKLKINKDSIPSILGKDVDDNFKNIFKEASPEKFDEILEVVKTSAGDIRNKTGFEYVGDRMSTALEQMSKRKSSIGQQKSTIINKARVGLEDFTTPTRETILDIQRALPDDAVAQSFIVKLKNVQTKLDADKVIDELQDTLYTGNRNLTIPQGSAADLKLRRIIGQYNGKLKKSLPGSYAKLNDEYAMLAENTNAINQALGEVVNGQATRGASLIKQFFSPSGTKTKELFRFVKDKTGIDLAQETTLAKFFMEVFDDPRSRSLLEGIPRTKAGVIDTVIDFLAEKTGITKGLSNKAKESTVKKARNLTGKAKP